MIALSGIRAEDLSGVWNDIIPYIQRALEHGQGEFSLDAILDGILTREMQLWVGHEDEKIVYVGVTQLEKFSEKLICVIVLLSGDRVMEWLDNTNELESWAMTQGADELRVMGRPGWKRVLDKIGYEHAYTVMVKKLGVRH